MTVLVIRVLFRLGADQAGWLVMARGGTDILRLLLIEPLEDSFIALGFHHLLLFYSSFLV